MSGRVGTIIVIVGRNPCSTGCVAAVTTPRMLRALGSGRESGLAVLAVASVAQIAMAKYRRKAPLSNCRPESTETLQAKSNAKGYKPMQTFDLFHFPGEQLENSRSHTHTVDTQEIRLRALIDRRAHENDERIAGRNDVATEQKIVHALHDLLVILTDIAKHERLHAPKDVHA